MPPKKSTKRGILVCKKKGCTTKIINNNNYCKNHENGCDSDCNTDSDGDSPYNTIWQEGTPSLGYTKPEDDFLEKMQVERHNSKVIERRKKGMQPKVNKSSDEEDDVTGKNKLDNNNKKLKIEIKNLKDELKDLKDHSLKLESENHSNLIKLELKENEIKKLKEELELFKKKIKQPVTNNSTVKVPEV